nr:MAG TPA: hypothetical protein [Caudoviricetes sp.]
MTSFFGNFSRKKKCSKNARLSDRTFSKIIFLFCFHVIIALIESW